MANKSETPETLKALVVEALTLVSSKVGDQWSYEFDRNRVKFRGPGPEFSVRDKDGFFTIAYEYKPKTTTTRHHRHEHAVRFLVNLFMRPQVGSNAE